MHTVCGICMDLSVYDTIGGLLCGHDVCIRCQMYLKTDDGCPYCRRPLYDVSAWYITFVRNLRTRLVLFWNAVYHMADIIIENRLSM